MSVFESLAIQPNVYYTPEEASQLLRVSQDAILRLLESQRVAGVKIDHEWWILGASLLGLTVGAQESEATLVADWLAASSRSLKEVWDNEEDALHDKL